MQDINEKIEHLKEEIAALEEVARMGYYAREDSYSCYDVDKDHITLYSFEGEVLGIIVDEQAVRRYLANKESSEGAQ